jgi:hypothetical protein
VSTKYALPPEPPLGTVVRGKRWDYVHLDVAGERHWAAGRHPTDLMAIPAWTWGEVLNDGPVTVIDSPKRCEARESGGVQCDAIGPHEKHFVRRTATLCRSD